MGESRVPLPTLERLATYLRYLNESMNGDETMISSARMEEATGIHAAQFRKDLSYFGEFGQAGIGYRIDELRQRIAAILKVESERPVLLVGAGNLGSALLGYAGLPQHMFPIVGVFDNNPNKIGYKLWDRTITSISEIKEANAKIRSQIAIVCVPSQSAQTVADQLVEAGIKVILNFAPTVIRVPDGIFVRNVCFVQELMVLSFFLSEASDGPDGIQR